MQLTDNLPAGVTFDSATPSQGSCSESGGTVTCALGTLADGADASVEIKVRPQSAGTITNQASVSLRRRRPERSSNNSASAETTVDPAADLSLTKTDSPDPVLAGQLLTYTLTVAQRRPADAPRASSSPTRCPAGVTFDSATPSQGSCSESSGTVTCALGTLAERRERDASRSRSRRQSPARSPTRPSVVLGHRATRLRGQHRERRRPPSTPAADLSLTKTDSPDPVLAGELLTYTLTVHNAGPRSATGVTLTDTLPAGVTFDSATPSQGSCSEASGTVTCALGTIANGADASVEIKVTAPGRRHDHQPGERQLRRRRPEPLGQLGERRDHRRPGRRPLG